VPHRNVKGLGGNQAKREAHQARLHGVLGGGFRIQGESLGVLQAVGQFIQGPGIQDGRVSARHGVALGHVFLLQLPEFQFGKKSGECPIVRFWRFSCCGSKATGAFLSMVTSSRLSKA
jgi:hypothetical protein